MLQSIHYICGFVFTITLVQAFHLNRTGLSTKSFLIEWPEFVERERPSMSHITPLCDDGKNNLKIDWPPTDSNYTCRSPIIPLDSTVKPEESCDLNIPKDYEPPHYCMGDVEGNGIPYYPLLPTHEGHRPVWPHFGEYSYIPVTRWLHSIEHGAIVFLYHPCAEPKLIDKIRQVLRSCIRKYIITPDAYRTSNKHPFAIISWGCRLTFNNPEDIDWYLYIRSHYQKGPELTNKEGNYTFHLLHPAVPPEGSDWNDSKICPNL